ncbi:MAG: hypothetical protein WCB44_06895 [Stellaceae bacterium]
MVRRKAAAALRCGAITIEEACRRYGLSRGEVPVMTARSKPMAFRGCAPLAYRSRS